MLGRRRFLGSSAGLVVSGSALLAGSKVAAATADAAAATKGFIDRDLRGSVGRLERLAQLDLESQMNFHAGFLKFLIKDFSPVVEKRFNEVLVQKGVDPTSNVPGPETLRLVADDPVISMHKRSWLSNQQIMYKALLNEFHSNEAAYLQELSTAETTGPGRLELDPSLPIPEYARHEIHIQPGGYVGTDFAGYLNYYSVNSFYDALIGANYQDEAQLRTAMKAPLPKDGNVLRVLDLGCGTGRLTFALKQRFPAAEIWGVDIAAPMLRFAHMRGVDLGADVNFRQRSAGDTGFPDNFFDMVTANILFHETSPEAGLEAMRETKRVLRPGGTFYPTDFPNGKQLPKRTAYENHTQWTDHTLNWERWRVAWEAGNFAEQLQTIGFNVDESVEPGGFGFGRILATKPA